jgi:hypothetical protein
MHWYPNLNSFFMFIRLNESRKSTTPRVAFKIQMNPSNLRAFRELSDHWCKTKIRTIHYSTKGIHLTPHMNKWTYCILFGPCPSPLWMIFLWNDLTFAWKSRLYGAGLAVFLELGPIIQSRESKEDLTRKRGNLHRPWRVWDYIL